MTMLGNSMFSGTFARSALPLLWVLSLASGCGSDGSDTSDNPMDGGILADADAEGSGGRSGQGNAGGGAGVDGGDGTVGTPTQCPEGEQDRDGDGVCAEACSAAFECGPGACEDRTGTARCVCPERITGAACEQCAHGYTGADCEDCAEGFIAEGDSCVEDLCAEAACGDHGSCVVSGSLAACACDQGFAGAHCDSCAEGYEGDDCDSCSAGFEMVPDEGCVPNVCIGHSCGLFGTCVDDAGVPACECNEGHEGNQCGSCKPGYYPSLLIGDCQLKPPPTLHGNLLLWQDADDRTTFLLNGFEGVISWRNKAEADNTSFVFPFDSTQKLSNDGGRTRVVFSGGDYGVRPFSLTSGRYAVYIVTKWQSDAEAGGSAPHQGILAGVDEDGEVGHGLWYETRSDSMIRYRHRFPFGGGGGDEVFGDLYDANQGLQLIVSQRRTLLDGHMRLYNGDDYAELAPLTKDAFDDPLSLYLGVNGPTGAGALEGEIAEILIYGQAHGNAARKEVEAYLRAKWNLAEPPAPEL